MFLITGLALYKALYDEFQKQEELIEKIHDILWKGPMSKLIRFLAFFIRRSRDPFHRYLQILGPNNEWFFPCPPWEKVSVEIQDGIGWHQKKCPYIAFFEKEGAVELTRAYGDMDERIAELLPENIELRRNTLCVKEMTGAISCTTENSQLPAMDRAYVTPLVSRFEKCSHFKHDKGFEQQL